MGMLDQETQIRNSDLYDDTVSPGSGMETPGASDQNIRFDLNALRSQLRRVIDPQGLAGTADWFVSVASALDNFGLRQIHDKKFTFKSPRDTNNAFALGLPEISSVDTVADVAGSLNSTYFIFYDTADTAYYVWYNVSGGGVNPSPTPPGGVTYTGIAVAITTGDSANTVASLTQTAINSSSALVNVGLAGGNQLTITNDEPGPVTDIADGAAPTGFTIAVDQQGTVGSAQGVVVSSAMVAGGSGIIGIGSSSTQNNAYTAATEANFTVAGTLGVGLSTAVSSQGVTLNEVDVFYAGTNDPPMDGGTRVFGLLQALTGTSDGTAIAAASSENLQISFVKIEPATDSLVAVTLPTGNYQFQLPYQQSFYSLDRGAFLSGGMLPDVIDPTANVVRLPFRHFDVTSNAAAGETFNVQTGVFSGTGASTVFATYGTPVLQSTAALFRDDNRTKIWRNGVLQSKGTGKDVQWVSATQISFTKVVKVNDQIVIESPATF